MMKFSIFIAEKNPYIAWASFHNELATIWRENKTKRHSHECRETPL